jgi:hypothetical protein
MLETFSVSTHTYEQNGKCLPLSVWAQQGFDTDEISRLTPATDKKDHPISGVAFRVRLIETRDTTSAGTKRSQVARVERAPEMQAVQDATTDRPIVAGNPEKETESFSGSSSTSNDSSPSQKKKSKDKDIEGEQEVFAQGQENYEVKMLMEREKAKKEKEEADAKAEEKRIDVLRKDADSILKQVAGPLTILRTVDASHHFRALPTSVKTSFQSCYDDLVSFDVTCNEVLNHNLTRELPDKQSVKRATADAKGIGTSLNTMISSLVRMTASR